MVDYHGLGLRNLIGRALLMRPQLNGGTLGRRGSNRYRNGLEAGSRIDRESATLILVRPVEALYENGMLRPAKPLNLRSGERVGVIVVRQPDKTRWDHARLASRPTDDADLAAAGLDSWADALDREDQG